MKWFKHDSDARNSLKLRKIRRKYGADGYAVYFFCLEAISYGLDKDNLTFELKEDAETIAFELSIQEKRVEEIMIYMVEIGLFEASHGIITCMKLAERIDKSMTNSPKLRGWLDANKSGNVMLSHDTVSTCAELDKKRKEKNKHLSKEFDIANQFDADRIMPVWNGLGCKKHKGLTEKTAKALSKTYKAYCKGNDEPKELNDWLESYLKFGFKNWMTNHHRQMDDGQWAADLEFAVRFDTYEKIKNTVIK